MRKVFQGVIVYYKNTFLFSGKNAGYLISVDSLQCGYVVQNMLFHFQIAQEKCPCVSLPSAEVM